MPRTQEAVCRMARRRSIVVLWAVALIVGLSTSLFGNAQSAQMSLDLEAYRENRPDEVATAALITQPQPRAVALAPGESVSRPRVVPWLAPLSPDEVRVSKIAAQGSNGMAPWEMGQTDDLEEFAAPLGPEPFGHTITTSFVGLDRPSAASGGFSFFPPDTIVAKGPSKVLEAVNSAVRLFATNGSVLATMNLNTFFSYPVSGNSERILFDPKVFYDRNAANPRFYLVALNMESSFVNQQSRIYLAVSRSNNPADLSAANWCRYFINSVRNKKKPKKKSWADYPGLGVGPDALVISTNQFTFLNFDFTYAVIWALNKAVLSNNAGGCPKLPKVFTWQPASNQGDGRIFTLQPVQSYTSPSSFAGTTNPAYLISTEYGTSSVYKLWRIRNVASGSPTLSGPVNLTGAYSYGLAPDAAQAGTSLLLSTGDNRMTSAAGIGNALYGVHGTLCNLGGGPAESCVRYVRITVGQNAIGGVTAALSQQITFGGGNGVFYFWPGIAVNLAQKIVVVFQRSAGNAFLSAYRTGKNLGDLAFEGPAAITNGTCSQTLTNRTGDYVGAQTDPAGTRFWVAGERAIPIGGVCVWQTWIQQLTPP
jgi:hypothetical protein